MIFMCFDMGSKPYSSLDSSSLKLHVSQNFYSKKKEIAINFHGIETRGEIRRSIEFDISDNIQLLHVII